MSQFGARIPVTSPRQVWGSARQQAQQCHAIVRVFGQLGDGMTGRSEQTFAFRERRKVDAFLVGNRGARRSRCAMRGAQHRPNNCRGIAETRYDHRMP